MKEKPILSYERVKANNIKVTYSDGERRTEVIARVVKPGSYNKSDTEPSKK